MSRKLNNSSLSLLLTFGLVVTVGAILGVEFSRLTITPLGSSLVLVATLEAGSILAGLYTFQRRQRIAEKLGKGNES